MSLFEVSLIYYIFLPLKCHTLIHISGQLGQFEGKKVAREPWLWLPKAKGKQLSICLHIFGPS